MARLRVSESKLQQAVAVHFRKNGYVVAPEVQFFTKRVDLFAVHRASLMTVAVETKMHDWKRALSQARIYLLCAHRVFVATPSNVAYNIIAKGQWDAAIGLLAVKMSEAPPLEWRVSVVVPALESDRWKNQYVDRLRAATLFAIPQEEEPVDVS